ncbi:MAG: hypothetical protein KatS3mg113_0571 [Planctomycetaceae bacterium]|nr:MAG: hypothetical protein KatS3mg113_0571 [Planctomycetaceae bacterium]
MNETFNRPYHILCYICKRNLMKIIIYFVAIIICAIFTLPNQIFTEPLWTWLEPLLGISTLFVAVWIFFEEGRESWEQQLPKKLNAIFIYENERIMECLNAVLTSEADIRQWGQQLGKQMNRLDSNHNPELKLHPYFRLLRPQLLKDHELGYYKLYEIHMYLSSKPEIIEKHNCKKFVRRCYMDDYEDIMDDNKIKPLRQQST